MNNVTYREETGCGRVYVHIGHEKDRVRSLRAKLGKSGTCPYVGLGATCKAASTAFKHGAELDEIIDDLNNWHCAKQIRTAEGTTYSCVDGLAKALRRFRDEYKAGA